MAANTSFADFPRLAALQAGDGFLPKQFTFRGSRLVFSWGIILLAGFASALILIFQGSVTRLIPLYAIGVFLSFTLSQTGMTVRWRKIGRLMATGELTPERTIPTHGSFLQVDPHWVPKMILNGVGGCITAIVTLIFLVTKFTSGAWIIAILVPGLLWLFFRIHHHYRHVAELMSTAGQRLSPQQHPVYTIVLVADVHRETMRLVEFAQALGVRWEAVHIAVQAERVPEIQRKWQERVGVGKLTIVPSPYRSLTRPLRWYIEKVRREYPEGYIQVIMGELRTGNTLAQLLHQNAHIIEQLALRGLDRVVTTTVPLELEQLEEEMAFVAPTVEERMLAAEVSHD
jgi:hypothetical protein